MPRLRLTLFATVLFLVSCGWVAVGCNAILGIDDHELAGDGGATDGGARDSGKLDGGTRGNDGGGGDGDDDNDDGEAGFDAGPYDGGSCPSPGITQCLDGQNVQICGADGRWETPFTCATSRCEMGSCSGSTADAPSCVGDGGPGIDSCGLPGESCCTSLEVAGGSFARTFDEDDAGSTYGPPVFLADGGPLAPGDPATVSGFRLDKYEVTVGRFRTFVAALASGGGQLAAESGKHGYLNDGNGLMNGGDSGAFEQGWDPGSFGPYIHTGTGGPEDWANDLTCTATNASEGTWTPGNSPGDVLPINCVNWFQAYAFCIWDGGFLPSEAEWEYAAAGGAKQLPYPWGNSFDGSASYSVIQCDFGSDAGACPPGTLSTPGTAAVQGVGTWGQLDLSGNVWEWVLDYQGAYPDPCVNCSNVTPNSGDQLSRVNKGGGFDSPRSFGTTTVRGRPATEDGGATNVGIRCARKP